jgi:DNA (cytosine-5)-methyltransferase 1
MNTAKPADINEHTFIDLFCGCGGFSIGLETINFKCLAGVDFNAPALESFRLNHSHNTKALQRDLSKYTPEELAEELGVTHVDVIVGGPPCQGFSTARQYSGTNSGGRLVPDARRELYQDFLRFIAFFRPKAFVMENVLGMRSSQNGKYFSAIQNEARMIGYRVVATEVNAWEHGAPQQRRRQLFIGTQAKLPIFSATELIKKTHGLPESGEDLEPLVTLGEAIGDLPALEAGSGEQTQQYDHEARRNHLQRYSGRFLFGVVNADKCTELTWHCARKHIERDLRDFAKIREGESCRMTLARGEEMEFPYNRDTFKDRYKRQGRNELCSTIVAHLKNDGLHFIHPTQNRSLTPREAARIQTFPDTFMFAGTRSNVYTQVGNAVPPVVGRAIGKSLQRYFHALNGEVDKSNPRLDEQQRSKLLAELEDFVNRSNFRLMEQVPGDEFSKIWKSIHRLLPEVHPESSNDHGMEISPIPSRDTSFCIAPYYIRSGWPVELAKIAAEARRRHSCGQLSSDEYLHRHCSTERAQI